MTLPASDATTLDHETAHDDDAPTWSDLDTPAPRVHLPVVGQKRTYPRRSRTRAVTILHPGRASKREIHLWAMEADRDGHGDYERPRTRGDCLPGGCNGARPCPWVSCVHHLALDVTPGTGAVKDNCPDLEVWEMRETCALDIADRGGMTLGEVGDVVNLTRERVRQLENRGLTELRRLGELSHWLGEDAAPTTFAATSTDHRDTGSDARTTGDAIGDLMLASPYGEGVPL